MAKVKLPKPEASGISSTIFAPGVHFLFDACTKMAYMHIAPPAIYRMVAASPLLLILGFRHASHNARWDSVLLRRVQLGARG